MTVKIELTRGQYALVDDADFHLVEGKKWYAVWNEPAKTFYAVRTEKRADGKRRQVYMHRIITKTTNPKIHVDHRNHKGTDNQRCNLRVCKPSMNHANRKFVRGKSRFKGVFWDARCNKWFAKIVVNRKPKYLGVQETEEAAALAYNRAAVDVFGEFAFLNSLEIEHDNGSESPANGVGNISRTAAMAG